MGMSNTSFSRLAIVVFTILGAVHLYRGIVGIPLTLGSWQAPIYVSFIESAVFFFLAYMGYRSTPERGDGFNAGQIKEKAENKEKVMQLVRERGRVQNDDVERLVGVSNATAERYLNELEKEGKLTQHGAIGHTVFYTLK